MTTASYSRYMIRGLMDHCTFTIYNYNGPELPGTTLECPDCHRLMVLSEDRIWRGLIPSNELLAEHEARRAALEVKLEGATGEQANKPEGRVFDVVFDDVPDTVAPAETVAQTQPRAPWGDTTLVREEDPDSGKHRNVSTKPRPEQVPPARRIGEAEPVVEEVPDTVQAATGST